MDNRKKILKVSLDLFHQKGYDAISVQEIVERAGITKPTLYYYFGSKNGLLQAILEDGFSRLRKQIDPVMRDTYQRDIRDVLFDLAKAFLSFATSDSKFFFFMLSLMYSARQNEAYEVVKPHLHKLYRSVIELFEKEEYQLGNMNGRQEQFAMGFLGFLNQYAFTFSEKHYEEEYVLKEHVSDEAIRALVQQFMYGIVS